MNWEPSDTARLRDYTVKSGNKLRAFLQSQIPTIKGTSIESVALEAKYKEGCEFMLRQFDSLLVEPDKSDDASNGSFAAM